MIGRHATSLTLTRMAGQSFSVPGKCNIKSLLDGALAFAIGCQALFAQINEVIIVCFLSVLTSRCAFERLFRRSRGGNGNSPYCPISAPTCDEWLVLPEQGGLHSKSPACQEKTTRTTLNLGHIPSSR